MNLLSSPQTDSRIDSITEGKQFDSQPGLTDGIAQRLEVYVIWAEYGNLPYQPLAAHDQDVCLGRADQAPRCGEARSRAYSHLEEASHVSVR